MTLLNGQCQRDMIGDGLSDENCIGEILMGYY